MWSSRSRQSRRLPGYSTRYTRNVLGDSRVHLIFADGRNRLLAVPKQYDVVISGKTSDMWVAGRRLCRPRAEFLPHRRREAKSWGYFRAERSDTGVVARRPGLSRGYVSLCISPHADLDVRTRQFVCLGTRESVGWDYGRLQNHFAQIQGVAADLNWDLGIWRPFALFGGQVLGESESDAFTREVDEFNTDDRPTLRVSRSRALCT